MKSDAQDDPRAPARPLEPAQKTLAGKPKITAREARRRRRKSRRRHEEILAWILVPLIVLAGWWAVNAGFEFFGTTPGTVWDQMMQVKKQLERRG